MMRSLFSIGTLALILTILTAGQFGGGAVSVPVEEGASAPSDTTKWWINTANGHVYRYHSWATLWLSEPIYLQYDRNALAVSNEGLRFGANGSSSDTTTTSASEDGYYFSDSLMISEIMMSSSGASAPACSLELFEVNGGTVTAVVNTGFTVKDTVLANLTTLGGPGVYAAWIAAGSTQPDRPSVRFKTHLFARP